MFLMRNLKIKSADLEKSVFEFVIKTGEVGITVSVGKKEGKLHNYFKKICAKDRCLVVINPIKIRGFIIFYRNLLSFRITLFGFTKITGKGDILWKSKDIVDIKS